VRSLSLRRRLLLGFASVALALVVGGFILAATMRTALIDRVDEQLEAAPPAEFLARSALTGSDEDPPGPRSGYRLSEFVVAVFGPDNELLGINGGDFADEDAPLPDGSDMQDLRERLEASDGRPVLATVAAEDGSDRFRVRALLLVEVNDGAQYMVVVGQSLADVEETFDDIVLAELLTATAGCCARVCGHSTTSPRPPTRSQPATCLDASSIRRRAPKRGVSAPRSTGCSLRSRRTSASAKQRSSG
jgi:hypothetical protein